MKRIIILFILILLLLPSSLYCANRYLTDSLISYEWTLSSGYNLSSSPSDSEENSYANLPISFYGQAGIMISLLGAGIECGITGDSHLSSYIFPALFYFGIQDFILIKFGQSFSPGTIEIHEYNEFVTIDPMSILFNTFGIEITWLSFVINNFQLGFNTNFYNISYRANNELKQYQTVAFGITFSNKPKNKFFSRHGVGLFYL